MRWIGICFKKFIMKKAYLFLAVRHLVPKDRLRIIIFLLKLQKFA